MAIKSGLNSVSRVCGRGCGCHRKSEAEVAGVWGLNGTLVCIWHIVWFAVVFLGLDGTSLQRVGF